MNARQANDRRKGVKLACQDPDKIAKIGFDHEGRGPAYTKTGVTYDKILERLGDPIFPISDDWLPDHGYAWVIIDGGAKDNVNDRYPVAPPLFNDWSYKDRELWNKASHVLGIALRHPIRNPPRLAIRENGWAM